MKILITGAAGRLGSYLSCELQKEGLTFEGWTRQSRVGLFTIDLTDLDKVSARIRRLQPNLVFHLAVAGQQCSLEEQIQTNEKATQTLVNECAKMETRLIFCSTEMVFSGDHAPYQEEATPHPFSNYGRTKLAAEKTVGSMGKASVIARLPLMYGRTESRNFFNEQLAALKNKSEMKLFVDEWRTPMSYLNVAQYLVKMIGSDVYGVIHLGGPERMSRYEMGARLAKYLGVANPPFIPSRQREQFPEQKRHVDLSMSSQKLVKTFPNVVHMGYEESLVAMGVR